MKPNSTTSISATVTRASPDSMALAQPIEAGCSTTGGRDFDFVSGMRNVRAHVSAILSFGHVIRAIVFDFDGLILDTEEPIYRSWLEVYHSHGEELPFERWVQIV